MFAQPAVAAFAYRALLEGSAQPTERRVPSLYGEPPCVERTTYKRTNDPRYIIRVVDSSYVDGRIARASYLIEIETGKGEDHMDVVSYDGGATWERD